MNMYADDMAIYIDGTNEEDVLKCLSDELVRVSKWCQNNHPEDVLKCLSDDFI